jgi:hypothetical protein
MSPRNAEIATSRPDTLHRVIQDRPLNLSSADVAPAPFRDAAPAPYRSDDWLTAVQAAAVCGVTKPTLLRWTSRGEFCPAARKLPNGQWRVRYGDLTAWLEGLPSQ